MARFNNRAPDALRPVTITLDAAPFAEGSALIEVGSTRVLCAASIEPGVPGWMRGQGSGWLTAEYALLPRATQTRNRRERNGVGGRTQEIQRLIGRSLRAAIDLAALGEYTITIDCDVLQADGGTRTAAITGSYVALARAVRTLRASDALAADPLRGALAAVSVGLCAGEALLDLDYSEDHIADVDCNVVQTDRGAFVEIQGTAEGTPMTREQLDTLLALAQKGIEQLLAAQREALAR